MNKILKNTLILTAITLIAGLGLGLVHEITLNQSPRRRKRRKKKLGRLYFQMQSLMSLKRQM